jgi:hypothetical protein
MTDLLNSLYWYCTDFCISAANLLGITYIEFNFMLFILFYPLVLVFLVAVNVNRYIIKRIKNKS